MKSLFYLISIVFLWLMFTNGVLLTIVANQRIGTAFVVISLSLAIILVMIHKNDGKRKNEKDSSTASKREENAEEAKKLLYRNMSNKNKIIHIVTILFGFVIFILSIIRSVTGTGIGEVITLLMSLFIILQAYKYNQLTNKRDLQFWVILIMGLIFFVLSSHSIYAYWSILQISP